MPGESIDQMAEWIRIAPPPTWDALISVLRSPAVGAEKKAQELEEKFCRVTPALSGTNDGADDTSLTHDQHEVTPGKPLVTHVPKCVAFWL